jgi:uncharacterized protein (DUF433 family)
MKKRSKLLIGVVVAILALTVLPLAAFAQQSPDAPPINPVRTIMRALTDTVAQTLDMTPQALVRALHEGKTPAQLADEAGVAREDLAAAMQATWNAQGEALIDKFIENGLPQRPDQRRQFKAVRQWTKISAETLEMPVMDFVQALRSGQTPAQIAEEHGSSGQALIDAIVAAEREHLDKAVADGKLAQEKADEILTRVTETAGKWVENNMSRPPRRQR